ncbi:thermonuclease family protein [Prosthecomicrobium pneumaticum]|uniref:Endonuclease YncB(Thermonuclease family) n=1 Tax=Prosthecomicrobium pneumaticum TaxID=81895 RepID=A0A7W9CV10_9HYPH|nr:thermonuclease family protein [Prosthecomicrobium pneumaticum]MBB5752445.1 endonuclease YncB(thermonuclease family) [Prosthecomicrobium pneumaticum]
MLAAGEAGRVAAVPDGATLVLEDGLVVRLAGLAVPGSAADPQPAAAAREALADLALGRRVELRYSGPRRDRHGRARAHVFRVGRDGEPALWLQRALVEAGRGRFASAADDRACLVPLAAAERAARSAGSGLWHVPDYHIRAARDSSLLQQEGLYELVEGRVLSIGRAGRRIYLNFGRRWTSDFTAEIEAQAEDAFAAAGVPVETLEGRIVRVRGWIEEHGGPLVRITHPEQIEILDEADGGN